MIITDLTDRVLRDHARRPNMLFYDIDPLGSMFGKGEIELLDSVYTELANSGLMESSGSFVSFFGEPKRLYRITELGRDKVR